MEPDTKSSRRIAVVAVAVLIGLLAALPGGVWAEGRRQIGCTDSRGCPDLIVDEFLLGREIQFQNKKFSEDDCAVVEGMVQPGKRRLLRFTFASPNIGPGALIVGAPADYPDLFEFASCHGHIHFQEYADYRLWTPEGYQAWRVLRDAAHPRILSGDLLARHPQIRAHMVEGEKRGFCVADIIPADIPGVPEDPRTYYPADGQTWNELCNTNQGISVGWADVYPYWLEGQWIDVTDVPKGDCILEAEVNAEHVFEEADYSNNSAAVPVRIR